MNTQIRELPILLSGPMVRATTRATNPKSHTRRIVKPQPTGHLSRSSIGDYLQSGSVGSWTCPYGQPGDRLWVREAWAPVAILHQMAHISYRAEGEEPNAETSREVSLSDPKDLLNAHRELHKGHWIPSIHMPRWASRILLEIVEVTVERLKDITEEDARAEGVEPVQCTYTDGSGQGYLSWREGFRSVWRSIYGAESWDQNPFVWVVKFKRIP